MAEKTKIGGIMRTGKLSVIVPAYNEIEIIKETEKTLREILTGAGIDYELVFIDDGSKDGTWDEIDRICKNDEKVVGIRFARNFGKEAAMLAGLRNCTGDCAVVIDCDLQHPPEKIVEMYGLWQQGYEVIEGVKKTRGKESFAHKVFARFFYKIMSKTSKIDMLNASDFKLLDRKAVDAIKNLPERNMFFRALSSWVGFKQVLVPFEVQERKAGRSHWSSWALFKYAVTNITAFSAAPMYLVIILGLLFFAMAIVLGIIALVQYFTGTALEGFTTVIIIELIIGSVVMTGLGIVGFYVARMYDEVKGRPRYILTETRNTKDTVLDGNKSE